MITYTNLAGVLSLRLSDDIVIGDYDPCEEMDCPSEMQACGQGMTREQVVQLDSLSAMVEDLLNSNIPLPATLLRIRICDGREIYVLPAWLQYFTGFYYTILDQVEVTDYNQSFPVTYSNGVQDTVTFNNLSLSLFLVGDEISINDYSPCLDDLPCDEEPVSCPDRSLATLQDDWIQLNLLGTGGYFETAPSLPLSVPDRLYRVRFCSGAEYYVRHGELYDMAWSGFKILQTIHITDLNQIFQIQDANGSTSLGGYQALLNYRKLTVEDFALNGYACEDYTETDTPDCPQDTLGIASGSLALIRDSMSNKTPQTIQIPNQLHRIELCDGREDHLLNEEINQLQGDYVITQTIDIPDTLQTYATATASGVSQQPLEAVLAIRSSGQALYLEGFEPPNIPGNPGTDVWNGGDPFGSVLSELRAAIQPEVSYYIQDHLGNTRVMYHTDLLSCQDYDVLYRLEHVLDYYPYGKTLREYIPGPREKFQSTEHERDLETGLDHRGARMYDGDVGRFLGVDSKANAFYGWSPFSYGLNNLILMIDPDGDSTRVYNSIGEYQMTINDNLPNQDHFFSQSVLDNLCSMDCTDVTEQANYFRSNSDFYIGAETRDQLNQIQGKSSGESGFVLYPNSEGQLMVYDIDNLKLSSGSNHFRVNREDIRMSLAPYFYTSLVGSGHTHSGASGPSPAGIGFGLSDYSPVLHSSANERPAHMAVVAGSKSFTIYTTAKEEFLGVYGWSHSFPGKTSSTIKYNGIRF